MKTEYAIKTDIYNYLMKSELVNEVTGLLKKTSRPKNSTKEDIIISVLSNVNGQNQEAERTKSRSRCKREYLR